MLLMETSNNETATEQMRWGVIITVLREILHNNYGGLAEICVTYGESALLEHVTWKLFT